MKSSNAAGVRPRLGALSLEISEVLRGTAAARRRTWTPSVLAASALAVSFQLAPKMRRRPHRSSTRSRSQVHASCGVTSSPTARS